VPTLNLPGLPEEHVVTLKADHRYMNKFETPNDENYQKVRDRLAATVDVVIKRSKSQPTVSTQATG
jgi:hypothetical protein